MSLKIGSQLEPAHTAEHLAGPIDYDQHNEAVTVLSGQNLAAGAVVGRVDRGVGGLTIPTVVGTGNGTMTALFAGPDIEEGDYVITCITPAANGGTFSVVTPSGKALPNAVVGTPYVSRHLNFTLNDGSTDYIATDAFRVSVAAGTTAPVVGTGNGTVTAITLGPDAQTGDYTVEITGAVTNGGVVQVKAPDGTVVESDSITAGAGGTLVLAGRHINLTITDGSTDFAKGDSARIAVFNKLVKKVVAWHPRPTAFDGRQRVAGVLFGAVDATSADAPGVATVRGPTQLVKALLSFAATVSAAEKESAYAQLKALGLPPL